MSSSQDTWQGMEYSKSQRQRSAERKQQDKIDHLNCMERESHTCQRCGAPATQTHHGKRKHAHVRNDPTYHFALCYPCHDWSHKNVADWNELMEKLII